MFFVGLVPKMFLKRLFVFLTLMFVIIVALWHLIIIISMSVFCVLVFYLAVDLAVIFVLVIV